VKLLRLRVLQQSTILLGFAGGFVINLVLFGFLIGVFGETPSNLRDLYVVTLGRVLLSLLGIGVLILGTTKSTEIFVRLRDCNNLDEIQAAKSASFWYAVAGFGLGTTLFYQVMVN
jgi:hypothetical protein